MKRTTVVLDEQVDKELTELAHQQGHSKEDLIRIAIDRLIQSHQQSVRELPSWVGAGQSDDPTAAAQTDSLLSKIYNEDYKASLMSQQPTTKREHSS